MSRILIRSGKHPTTALSPEATLAASRFAAFGNNAGNLLFSSSVTRMLSLDGTETVSDAFLPERSAPTRALADRINDEFDAYVVPMANAFRPQFANPLRRLAGLIEMLEIPVVVVGVGAQLPVSGDVSASPADLDEAVKRFTRAVLRRSASIGVRGAITEAYLRRLGVPADAVDVIGCPSIFDAGRDFSVQKKVDSITAESRIAFNTALTNPGAGRFVERMTEQFPHGEFVGQSVVELNLLLWGREITGHERGLPTHVRHPLFLEDRLRFFVDPSTWVRHLATRDFSVGARIHGNIAALLGGTPAVVLAADSRTLELADHHGIPRRLMPRLDAELDVAALHDEISFDEFNARVPENFDRYLAFLDRNGLQHAGVDRLNAPGFDSVMRATRFPGPVRPPVGPDGALLLLDRLRWLRQGAGADEVRREHAYTPDFLVRDAPRDLLPLQQRVRELELRIERRPTARAARLARRIGRAGAHRLNGLRASAAARRRRGA